MNQAPEKDFRCKNCETLLTQGSLYCHNCGQSTKSLKRPFWDLLKELIKSSFNLDNKFFSTLLKILFKPWKIINDHFQGKRVKYMHPVRLFLFANLALFSLTIFFTEKNEKSETEVFKITYNDEDSVQNVAGPGTELARVVNDAPLDSLKKWESYNQAEIMSFIARTDTSTFDLIQIHDSDGNEIHGMKAKLLRFKFRFLLRYRLYGLNGLTQDFVSLFSKVNFILIPFYAITLFFFFFRSNPYFINHLILMLFYFSCCYLNQSIGLMLDKLLNTDILFLSLFAIWCYLAFIIIVHKVFRKKKRGTLIRLIGFYFITTSMTFAVILYTLFYTLTGDFA